MTTTKRSGKQIAPSELGHVSFRGSFREMLDRSSVEYTPGCRVGVLALHAGIEGGTGEIAREVSASTGATMLNFWQETADRQLHLTSSRFDPEDCPQLRAFLDASQVVVSLHGHHRLSHDRHIFVGGGNRRLAARLARSLRSHVNDLTIVGNLNEMPPGIRGLHPANPVNRPAQGGVQLELPPCARGFVVNGPTSEEHPVPSTAPESAVRNQLVVALCRLVERLSTDEETSCREK